MSETRLSNDRRALDNTLKFPRRKQKTLLHAPTKARHTVKRWHQIVRPMFEIKNSDRNGPEGQFIAASTTMCNAGFPL